MCIRDRSAAVPAAAASRVAWRPRATVVGGIASSTSFFFFLPLPPLLLLLLLLFILFLLYFVSSIIHGHSTAAPAHPSLQLVWTDIITGVLPHVWLGYTHTSTHTHRAAAKTGHYLATILLNKLFFFVLKLPRSVWLSYTRARAYSLAVWSVSYTHLDVYKRQVSFLCKLCLKYN